MYYGIIVVDRHNFVVDKVAGTVWPGRSSEVSSDRNLEYIGTGEGDALVIL